GHQDQHGWQEAGQQQRRQGAQGGQGSQQGGWAAAGQQQRRQGEQGGQRPQGSQNTQQQCRPQGPGQQPSGSMQQRPQGPGQQPAGFMQQRPQGPGQQPGGFTQQLPHGPGQQPSGFMQQQPQGPGQQPHGFMQQLPQGSGQQPSGFMQQQPQGPGQQPPSFMQQRPQGPGQQPPSFMQQRPQGPGQQPGGPTQQRPQGPGQQPGGPTQQRPQGPGQQPASFMQQQPGGSTQQRAQGPGQQQGGQQGQQRRQGQQGDQKGGSYQQQGYPSGQPGGSSSQRGAQGDHQRGPRPSTGSAVSQRPSTAIIKRGTLGRTGTCAVNYLDVDLSKMPEIAYHYDVTIVPERPKKFYRQAFDVFRKKYLNNAVAAFDGRKSCYAVDKLKSPVEGDVEVIDRYNRPVRYTIAMKETDQSIVELSSLRSYMKDKIYDKPMRALQCLEVVLAEPCNKNSIRAGRSFFKNSSNNESYKLGDGYEALVGLYQSFVLGDKPFVNVDVSHKSFPIAMTVIDYLCDGIKFAKSELQSGSCNSKLKRAVSFLKGINIVYEPPKCFATEPRVYKVNGFSQQPANVLKFKLEDKLMTVEGYFKSRGYALQFPNLNCLHVGPPAKNIYLPVELCRIEEGQALNRKDGSNQVSAMIKFAATSTNERKAKIINLLRHFNHNTDPAISRFGIHIANDFITVTTRLLTPPQLEYYNKNFACPLNGSWNMTRCQFLKVHQKQHRWAIMYLENSVPFGKIEDLSSLVSRQSKIVNVNLEPKADIRRFRDERNLDEHFKDLKTKKYDLVFVVIPTRNGPSYDVIKQKAELQHGILTQCIKQFSIERRMSPQLVDNVLLKVNSKLNGINHKLKDDPRTMLANVMYLGADVTHPSPDQRDIPSVVGVAGSHDPYGASYNMQYRLQSSGTGGAREEIEDMESIVTEHLRVYREYRGSYPDHIIYYRDGVSDGQFMKIKNLELRGIYAACSKLKINPKMCCVIVVKRHHTRFFPLTQPHPKNKFNNVDPGTIVDHKIVHPNEMQFFMVSHQSIQGTAKPTRYNVIENTGDLDIDLLQQLTYNLCHMFPRCNRSVSYPAPAYLAHLAAARGRVYISNARLLKSPKEEYQKRLIVPEFLKTNPMYFV
ncbi:hypothetical protein KR093_002413, partial [Drosophila rubida]